MHFSFIQITDPHFRAVDTILTHGFSTNYAFQEVIRHIAEFSRQEADFIVATGDLVEHASDEEYLAFCKILSLRIASSVPGPQYISLNNNINNFPVYFLPGNHDDRSKFYSYLFSQSPKMHLMNVAFQHKGVQFVCLDWGTEDKAVAYDETLSFLGERLKLGLPSILLMHHHMQPVGSRWLDEYIADGAKAFWDIVYGKQVLGIFCGHVHLTFETQKFGIPVYTVGSTGFQFLLQDEPMICLTPPQYRIVTIDDGVLTSRVVNVPLER